MTQREDKERMKDTKAAIILLVAGAFSTTFFAGVGYKI